MPYREDIDTPGADFEEPGEFAALLADELAQGLPEIRAGTRIRWNESANDARVREAMSEVDTTLTNSVHALSTGQITGESGEFRKTQSEIGYVHQDIVPAGERTRERLAQDLTQTPAQPGDVIQNKDKPEKTVSVEETTPEGNLKVKDPETGEEKVVKPDSYQQSQAVAAKRAKIIMHSIFSEGVEVACSKYGAADVNKVLVVLKPSKL